MEEEEEEEEEGEEEEGEEVDEEGSATLARGVAKGEAIATSTSSLCCASSAVFLLSFFSSCAVQAWTTSRSKGGAQRLAGGATSGCFASKCIFMPYNYTVALHKV